MPELILLVEERIAAVVGFLDVSVPSVAINILGSVATLLFVFNPPWNLDGSGQDASLERSRHPDPHSKVLLHLLL